MAPHALVFLLCAAAVGASFRSDVQQPRASNGAVAADEFDADSPSWLDDAANESWPSPLVAPAVERVPSASASYTGARASSEMYSPESTWLPRSDGVGGGDDEAAAVEEEPAVDEHDADPDEWASQMSWLPRPSGGDAAVEGEAGWIDDRDAEGEAAEVRVIDDAPELAHSVDEGDDEEEGDGDRKLFVLPSRTRTRT